jgi:protein-S-isoprenylcysteine O-methyltransferase Ste14
MHPAHHEPGHAARAFAVAYLILEAAGIIAFWVALAFIPSLRPHFVISGAPDAAFLSLVLADAVLLPLAAIACALVIRASRPLASSLLWLHAGAATYAALVAFGLFLFDRHLWLGAGLMLPLLYFPAAIAVAFTPSLAPRATRPRLHPALRTLLQVVIFWTFFLGVVPAALTLLERAIGMPPISPGPLARTSVAIAIALPACALGIWSAAAMSLKGRGTPLPTDPPPSLVTCGPYAHIRNPMAVAGLGQALAVAIYLNSPLTLAYIALGCLIWQTAIRPREEQELRARFGAAYDHYRSAVRCWLPRKSPYSAPGQHM